MAAVGRSGEVPSGAATPGFVIHGPAETLRDFCREENGALFLEVPGGARFELVTSPSDPAIGNAGDGSFHPFDEPVVRAALAQTRFPLSGLSARVFVLPYPVRQILRSAAGPGLILLSPGVTAVPVEQQHAQVVHELGHVVHHALLPEGATERWSLYRELRGITDAERFHGGAAHADRPHEIFAEDFRALFGDRLANYSGTIENPSLPMPQSVQGLGAFFLGLAGVVEASGQLHCYPNPTRGALTLRRTGGEAGELEVFDALGRRVVALAPTAVPGGWSWRWDGRDPRGRALGAGVLFARVRGSTAPALRFVRVE